MRARVQRTISSLPFSLVIVMSLQAGKERFFILASVGMRYIAISARGRSSCFQWILAGIKRDRSLTNERDAFAQLRQSHLLISPSDNPLSPGHVGFARVRTNPRLWLSVAVARRPSFHCFYIEILSRVPFSNRRRHVWPVPYYLYCEPA